MKEIGKILKLFISEEGESRRSEKDAIELDKRGIIGDKFYNKELQRSILLSSKESYNMAQMYDIDIRLGQLGENILIDYNPYHLSPGTQLKMGETILEVTQNCTICNHLSKIDKKLPKLLAKDRGIFVKVIQEGILYSNDTVYLI